MRGFLERNGEHAVYASATVKLDERIASLQTQGIDVKAQVTLLQSLRGRVKKLCLTEEYLERYRLMIHNEGYQQHQSNNKVTRASKLANTPFNPSILLYSLSVLIVH